MSVMVPTLESRPRLRNVGPGRWQTLDRQFVIVRAAAGGWTVEGTYYRTLREAAIAVAPRVRPVGPFWKPDVGVCYLLHFDRPFGHARHYLGWTAAESAEERIERHRAGRGANLLRHVVAAGIGFELVRMWPGGRDVERQLKKRGGAARLCPVCREAKSASSKP